MLLYLVRTQTSILLHPRLHKFLGVELARVVVESDEIVAADKTLLFAARERWEARSNQANHPRRITSEDQRVRKPS